MEEKSYRTTFSGDGGSASSDGALGFCSPASSESARASGEMRCWSEKEIGKESCRKDKRCMEARVAATPDEILRFYRRKRDDPVDVIGILIGH